MSLPAISVIVTTYNWPAALDRVLNGLAVQDHPNMEVIIADDGSTADTFQCIAYWQKQVTFPIIHCWQADNGFQAAKIRNKAVALASHDYLVFIDGDCVPLPNFVSGHARLAEKGWFVAGNRILLSQALTTQVLHKKSPIHKWPITKWARLCISKQCNGLLSLATLPLAKMRKLSPQRWQGVKTCNLAIWRQDFFEVNGLDESYVGWGFEDSDLVIRLLRTDIKRKNGKYAVGVLHLWHPEQSKDQVKSNWERLQQTMTNASHKAIQGIEQYLNDYHDSQALE